MTELCLKLYRDLVYEGKKQLPLCGQHLSYAHDYEEHSLSLPDRKALPYNEYSMCGLPAPYVNAANKMPNF